MGICGGFQMLGQRLLDEHGIEGEPCTESGLGWLDMATVLLPEKQLKQRQGVLLPEEQPCSGYEIHVGVSTGSALEQPLIRFDNGDCDGARSTDGQVLGTYLHGIFDTESALLALLQWAGLTQAQAFDYNAERERQIDRLADAAAEHLDMERLVALANLG
jgi:adenosylcobyric acid synthase